MRRIKVWRIKLIGILLIGFSGFGFNFDPLQGSDCGVGLLILMVAGLWMLFGDPKRITKVLR